MRLLAFVERYALDHDVGAGQREQLRVTAKLLTRFAGGKLTIDSLCEELVNRWLVARREAGLSPETVRGNRTRILTLWRAAAEEGLVQAPKKIRPVKRIDWRPKAFTIVQLKMLLDAADRLTGKFQTLDIERRAYMRSFILADYDSAKRRGDLLALEREQIEDQPDGSGIVTFVQNKTGRVHRVCFRPETIRAIDECMASGPKRKKIWPNFSNPRRWFQWFRRLCDRAGVGGSSKWIRRSSASYVARAYGLDAGRKHLGHATPGLAERHYFDPSIVDDEPPLPPPLIG
jgi:integrase